MPKPFMKRKVSTVLLMVAWTNLACFLGTVGLASAQSANQDASTAQKLMIFGDSLTAGYGLPQADGFVAQLQTRLDQEGLSVQVIDASQSGDSTAQGLERLDWALFDQPQAFVLQLGANDALRGLPLADTEANLRTIIETLQAQSTPVFLSGMRATPSMGPEYQEAFDAIFPRLAQDYGLAFYPFFLEGVAADLSLNQTDGIHPNKQGVALIVDKLNPHIKAFIATLPPCC